MDVKTLIEKLNKVISDNNISIGSVVSYSDIDDIVEKMNTPIEVVYQKGGREGQGEYVCGVIYFKKYNLYLKIEGFYSSYNGCDFEDDWFQVFPKSKTITVYEKDLD